MYIYIYIVRHIYTYIYSFKFIYILFVNDDFIPTWTISGIGGFKQSMLCWSLEFIQNKLFVYPRCL